MRDLIARHRIACFLIVTYAVTWGAWLPLAIGGHRVTIGFEPQYLLGLLGPMIGALVTTALADGRRGLRELGARMVRVRAGLRWWLVALALPLAIYASAYVVLTAYSMFLLAPLELPTWATLARFNGFPVTNVLGLWLALLVVNGFGEETGWRGFLLPQLQRKRSQLVASLGVGVCWALWHVPAFFVTETYRAMPVSMIPVFFLGVMSGSVFLAWLYNRGRHSILLVAAWHATYNLLSGSVGARGAIAAVETTVVMIAAAVLVIQELRDARHDARHPVRDLNGVRS